MKSLSVDETILHDPPMKCGISMIVAVEFCPEPMDKVCFILGTVSLNLLTCGSMSRNQCRQRRFITPFRGVRALAPSASFQDVKANTHEEEQEIAGASLLCLNAVPCTCG